MDKDCRVEVIAVGSEIVLGQIHNSHAQYISQELSNYGFFVYHHHAVGDNESRIVEVFKQASSRSNVVIVTGGLGPTDDDLTKESLAKLLGVPLVPSPEALAQIEAYFVHRNRPMPERNKKQALSVAGGELLDNPNGTAPGQYVAANGVHYFLLPGPPLEMRPMLLRHVLPKLQAVFGGHKALVSRILHFCGIGESDVDEQIQDLTVGKNPTVAPLASEGEMLLRITAAADTVVSSAQLIEPLEAELRRRFGRYIYGVDDETLASAVGKALSKKGATLAVAESCTGGLLGSMITGVSGCSSYFKGGVISYSNDVKTSIVGVEESTLEKYGAVSEETAREMAEGVRTQLRSTYGLSITGIAGPDGGTPEKPVGLVYIAIAGPAGSNVFCLRFRGSREQIRLRACKQVLWRLWSALEVQ